MTAKIDDELAKELKLLDAEIDDDDEVPSMIETRNSSSISFEDRTLLPPPRSFPQRPRRHTARRSGISSFRTISSQRRSGAKSQGVDFAVQSIRRGSQEWRQLVKPFVADLVFYSIHARHFARAPLFRPYTCQAAVMFVDISGYSKIAAELAHKGAHALSTAVNSYLSRLLRIVHHYGGDVVKFAGDAVLCVWQNEDENKLEINVKTAAFCAMKLQQDAGTHAVEGTKHVFKIHIGLCCGTVESEIFNAPVHTQMQKMYHLVGGEAIEEIGDYVDLAKSGETCISADCVEFLSESSATYEDCDHQDAKLLTDLSLMASELEDIETHVEDTMIDRLQRRDRTMEEDFIHPSVLDLLSHGGMSPTQIAQMRDLVVLFIAQTSNASPINWLLEVQAVLDRNRCPLLQIVADDKGVHAIAAVNAVNSVPESRLLGLEICRELVEKKIGVAIGMAAGSTFCGVTGSSSVSCRWDITGGPPVRSARLMQYALKHKVELAIDESVYVGSTVPARMALLEQSVPIKGSPKPCRVFTLSQASEFAAMNLLETVHGEMHNPQVEQITKHITSQFRNRSAVVVTGPTLSGKKIVCQRAAGFAKMMPFLHVSDEQYGLLQLARTIATWFKYVDNTDVKKKAWSVLKSMDKNMLSCAHDECIILVDLAVEVGLVSCVVVDRVEFLDEYSLSLMRECLHGRFRRSRSSINCDPNTSVRSMTGGPSAGRIAFLCVHVPLYNVPSAKSIVEDITRSHRNLSVPLIEVAEASLKQIREMFNSMSMDGFQKRIEKGLEVGLDDRLIYAGSSAAGFCAGYLIERAAAISGMQPARVQAGKQPLVQMTEDIVYRIPPGGLREYRTIPVMQIGSEIAMRYAHVYDELPPMMQVFCKVLAVVSQTGFFWASRERIWGVLNDLIAEGVDDDVMSILLQEMQELYLIKVWTDDGEEFVKFQSPALGDIALDVCTPIQIQSIAGAWIERLKPDFKEGSNFRVPLVLAWLNFMLGQGLEESKSLWIKGYEVVKKESADAQWKPEKVDRWKELIACEIDAAGADVKEVLGSDFEYGAQLGKVVELQFLGLWLYRAPIGLGPLGHTFNVITLEIDKELVLFTNNTFPEEREDSEQAFASAAKRYVVEIGIVEGLLSQYDFGTEEEELEAEKKMIERISAPAAGKGEVYEKANLALNVFVPRFVQSRLQRLHSLTQILDSSPTPEFVVKLESKAIRESYQVMFEEWGCKCLSSGNDVDSAQHALMKLATLGWTPRPTPERLQHLKYQTVARLRNAVVKKLTPGQLYFFKHQQGAVDLKAFLVTTALLLYSQDTGKYSC